MISDSEYQAYQRAKSNSSTSVGSLQVGGNVDGAIVIGSGNVVHNYNVHTEHGTVVNLIQPPSVRLRTMHGKPLRPPASFVGRERYLTEISRQIDRNRPVFLYGPTGIGKSALIAQATNLEAARSKPHGVVYMEGVEEEGNALGKGDVIQRLFDSLFESTPPLKVNFSSARSYLSNTRPLVVLDHQSLDPSAFDSIAQLFPEGALL